MEIESRAPSQMSSADLNAWREQVQGPSPYGSPFFHPEYALTLAEFRTQVEVAVIRQNGVAVGWLPFERHAGAIGRPLGIKLADFQGAILRSDCKATLGDITQHLGLSAFHYDHLVSDQAAAPGHQVTVDSPYLDLRDGYEAYLEQRRGDGAGLVSQARKKHRKLINAGKTIEFRWHDPDPLALVRLWEWKSAQRQATGTMDILQFDWVRLFLQRIASTNRPGFHGAVSTLRIDGEIAAVHLGMHTDTTLHYWFPAYSVASKTHSPGSILLLHVAEECVRRGIQKIDLGKGDDGYKTEFANGVASVSTGTFDHSPVRQFLRTSVSSTKHWIKNSPLRSAARLPSRWWKQWRARTTMGAT